MPSVPQKCLTHVLTHWTIKASISCPRTLRHADCRGQGSDHNRDSLWRWIYTDVREEKHQLGRFRYWFSEKLQMMSFIVASNVSVFLSGGCKESRKSSHHKVVFVVNQSEHTLVWGLVNSFTVFAANAETTVSHHKGTSQEQNMMGTTIMKRRWDWDEMRAKTGKLCTTEWRRQMASLRQFVRQCESIFLTLRKVP